MNTEELKAFARKNNIQIDYINFCGQLKGIAVPGEGREYHIGISEDIRGTPKECEVLAHEIGHCMTNGFYNIDSSNEEIKLQEEKAEYFRKNVLKRRELSRNGYSG